MLLIGRALDYHKEINSYVSKHRELQKYKLTNQEWDTIALITRWLKTFRDMTTQISATKHATLSSTHGVFKGLQDHLAQSLAELPDSVPSRISNVLIAPHLKLSDYFWKVDQSPYPVWASRE